MWLKHEPYLRFFGSGAPHSLGGVNSVIAHARGAHQDVMPSGYFAEHLMDGFAGLVLVED